MAEKSPLTKTIKKVMPSVVSIVISKSLEAIEKEIPPELLPLFPSGDPHLQIPEEMIDARGMVKIGGGSGFIVDANGIIVTNKHVISDGEAEYAVITNDDKKYKAQILARDPIDDVAIIKINPPANKLPIVKLGDSSKVELGETVLAIGNVLGLRYITIDEDLKEKLNLPVGYGALVISHGPHSSAIIHNSPADKSGIKEKDIVLECNGEKISTQKTIQDFLENLEVGDVLKLKVLRQGKEFEAKAILSERK